MGELDAVRDAAADLLGLSLTVPGPANGWRPISGSSTWWRRRLAGGGGGWSNGTVGGCDRRRLPGRPGGAEHGPTCAMKPPTWSRSRSAGRGPICSTGWRRQPAGWFAWLRPDTPTAPADERTRWGQRPALRQAPQEKQRTRTRNSHNARKHWAGYSLCSTRPRPAPPRPAQPPGQV
jgi:hypothetical protein